MCADAGEYGRGVVRRAGERRGARIGRLEREHLLRRGLRVAVDLRRRAEDDNGRICRTLLPLTQEGAISRTHTLLHMRARAHASGGGCSGGVCVCVCPCMGVCGGGWGGGVRVVRRCACVSVRVCVFVGAREWCVRACA